MRLDVFLTERGLAPSRQRAKLLIESGCVLLNGKAVGHGVGSSKKRAEQAAAEAAIEALFPGEI